MNTNVVSHASPPVVLGGHDHQLNTIDDIMAYDDSNNSWRTVSYLPMKCCWMTALSLPHTIFMAGGCSDSKTTETAKATSL